MVPVCVIVDLKEFLHVHPAPDIGSRGTNNGAISAAVD
jgi:hypothetical protein